MRGVETATSLTNYARPEYVTFVAGGAITAGDWLAFDVTAAGALACQTVVQATSSDSGAVVGVADESVSSGADVRVQIGGYRLSANVASATAAGDLIAISSTAGRAATLVQADTAALARPCGVALKAGSSNTAQVLIFKVCEF